MLLNELQDPWYRFCLSLLRDPEAAREAVQETGLRFLKQLAGFRGNSQLRTWSFGIALNVVRESKRRRARHPPTSRGDDSDMSSAPDPRALPLSAGCEDDEARAALRLTLAELPDRQREAVVLRFFEDLSVEETAAAMGCAAGTVKATVHQAIRSLRQRLKPWA
ncbi:MAG: polymerase, sigma-24 subunit, subfamily [Phycisphaerales bacterium]|nr:polymerase, sigma-24 subunit, subfamily [Phycisphaerales bacterium]